MTLEQLQALAAEHFPGAQFEFRMSDIPGVTAWCTLTHASFTPATWRRRRRGPSRT